MELRIKNEIARKIQETSYKKELQDVINNEN